MRKKVIKKRVAFAAGNFTVSGILLLFIIFSVSMPYAAEHKYGASLRENVLLMKTPAGIDEALLSDKAFGISQTSLRLYDDIISGRFSFSLAIETKENLYSSGSGLFGFSKGSNGIFSSGKPLERVDASFEHISDNSTSLRTRLERFDASWRLGSYNFQMGRQPVSLGTSHFIGVLDVVAPFAPGDLDATYKPGVDALRVRRNIGMDGEAEVIAVGAKPWGYGAIIGRVRKPLKSIDIEITGGRFRERGYGGIAWEGGIGELGIWGEMALFERNSDKEQFYGGRSKAAFSGVAGLDVNLPSKFKAGGGLMFQDFGVRDPNDLAAVYNDAPFKEGWLFLASSSYGLLTLHREIHPLVNADVAGIFNLIDGSTLWQPKISVSAGNNADLNFYGWIGTGKHNTISPFAYITRSEFGSLPAGGGFYARWFF